MFLVIMIIVTLIITLAFSSLYYAYSTYDSQLYDKSYRLLNLSSTTIDMELKKLESMSLTIISDKQIQEGLQELQLDDSEYAGYVIRKRLTDRLWAHISTAERYVQSVYLLDANERASKYGETVTLTDDKYARMLELAKGGRGAVRWLYPDEGDPMLMMVREVRVYEPMTLKPIGMLMLRINIKRLVEDYAGVAAPYSDIVLKAGGQVIYPYDGASTGMAQAMQAAELPAGYAIKRVNGEAMFLSHKTSGYTGWTYYNFVPYNHIFEQIVLMKNAMIAVFVITVLIAVFIGFAFARSLTKPIRLLINQMKEVQQGNLDSMDAALDAPVFHQMDEVGLLQRTFRLMMARINTLIKENYTNQLIIKETEFKALQAQINPHFLYNALDSIHWLAKKSRQEQISSMVVSLGYLLRSSISLKRNVITLAEELEIVRHYITIQKYRFQHRLHFHMDVPDTFAGVAIPKLTLQPLVENAIQYGLEPMIEPCAIRIYVVQEHGRLAVIVEDQGPGMEEGHIERVLSGEVKTRGTGIGLTNIRDRLQLAFGCDYGLRVESTPGAGTRVSILLPYAQEESA